MKEIRFEIVLCCKQCGNSMFIRETDFYICTECNESSCYCDLVSFDRNI